MTICLTLVLKDKVILASDSAVRITHSPPENSYTSYHGQKLFEFPDNVGCLHFGAGRIGMKTIEELIIEFKENNKTQIDNLPYFITTFMNFIKDKLIQFPTQDYNIGFYFVKIGKNQIPLIYTSQITNYIHQLGQYPIEDPTPNSYSVSPYLYLAGDIELANIFIKTPILYKSLIMNNNLNETQVNRFIKIMDKCNEPEDFLDVSEEEGIEFSKFLMKTIISSTNEYRKIEVVGEPIDIAVISKNGFKWIQRKTIE